MKRALVVRLGAIGDVIQASSVLPGLKEQGWHITFQTEELGCDVLRHDPHIDAFMTVAQGKVPLDKLTQFWGGTLLAFDHFVNLTEVVEVNLLKSERRLDFYWSDAARRAHCDYNYVEMMHHVAEVPYTGTRQWFYATDEERGWADWYVEARGGGPRIVWALAGSAQHKIWRNTPLAVVRVLLERPDVRITMTGGQADQPLGSKVREYVAAIAPHCLDRLDDATGTLGIRETLTLATKAELVVGPETGVLNAVAAMAMPKVCILSHSTITNLTRDWVNTHSVVPDASEAPCYPCHRLHNSLAHCPQKDGAAACQTSIPVDQVVGPILEALG